METKHAQQERYERMIDEVIAGELSASAWQELRAHLVECATCRGRYDRVAMAERLLHGGPAALARPSPASFERIGAAVIAGAVVRPPAWQRLLQWLAPPQRWATMAAAAALLLALPWLLRTRVPSDEFQSRGGGAAAERAAGLRAFCLDEAGVTPRCSRASQLHMTVSNGGHFERVFVVGLDDGLELKWYAPRPPQSASVTAPAGVDVPLGAAVRLGVNHDPGKVRIYALFSDAPLTANEVEAAAERMRREHALPSQREALPLERADVVQKSVMLDVLP
jgi:hypothetical protein